jgi:hypothetical protein
MSEEQDRDDEQIDDVLAGRGVAATDPTVLWLAATARPAAPPTLLARIEAQMTITRSDRPGLFLSIVASVLAIAFVVQGLGGLVMGEWIADNLGEPYAPHLSLEGGLALIALGVCAAAGAVSRRWSTVSVLTCTPLAIGFGLHGFTEVGVFAAGVALHAVEGICGVLLAVAWWWDRRDRARGS